MMRQSEIIEQIARSLRVASVLIVFTMPTQAQHHVSRQLDAPRSFRPLTIGESAVPAAVEEFIARLNNGIRAIYANSKNDLATMREGCRSLVHDVLDLDAMAQSSSVTIWDQMTIQQRTNFRSGFEHRMIEKCVRQFGESTGELLGFVGLRTTDNGQLLATLRAGEQDDGKLSSWRLQTSQSGSLRAIDIIIEGRSVVGDASSEFLAVLRGKNGDVDELIKYMWK